jgi:hypothetical protein
MTSVYRNDADPLQRRGLRAVAAADMVEKFQPQDSPNPTTELQRPRGYTVRQPQLTSLIGLRDSDGDQLHLVRLDRADGSRRYLMAIGQERVFLTPGDLDRLSTVIRCEVGGRNDDLKAAFRFLAHAIWLVIFCAVLSLLASALTGPLFAYPWSN